jgi:hypothetical protein
VARAVYEACAACVETDAGAWSAVQRNPYVVVLGLEIGVVKEVRVRWRG